MQNQSILSGGSKPEITWFSDFVGVGYRYHDVYMNVFPLFSEKMPAFKLWNKTIDWWPDDQIRLRFVEDDNSYWFILFGGSEYKKDNTGFVKKVPMSENYQRFKVGYEKKAMLRFGVYKENVNPKRKERDGSMKKFDLEILKKSKSVYDIAFLQLHDIARDSVEWQCIIQQRGEEKNKQ